MKDVFDLWNRLKKELSEEKSAICFFPKEGEVWMSILGKNIGFEQDGSGENFSRPILVIKKFNNQMFWCVPLSTHQKSFNFYYNFTDPFGDKVSAILAQVRLMSIKRFSRKIYYMPPSTTKEIIKFTPKRKKFKNQNK